uniref:Replicase polyprotein n=1 Tax=Lygus hesperus TaxID=30085 RepID=A0A146LMK3_LYGHE
MNMTDSNSVLNDMSIQLNLSKAIYEFVAKRVDPKDHLTNLISTSVKDGLGSLSQNDCQQTVDKIMTSFKNYCNSEEGTQFVDQLVTKVIKHASEEFTESITKVTESVNRSHRIAKVLVQGLTYHQMTKNRAVFTAMFGFILSEIFDWNITVTGLCMSILNGLYERMVPEQTHNLHVQSPTESRNSVVATLTSLWEMVCKLFNWHSPYPVALLVAAVDLFNFVTDDCTSSEKPTYSFFGAVCRALHQMYVWLMDKLYGVRAFSRLLYQDNKVMKTWASEAVVLVDPTNEHFVMDDDGWFSRLAACYAIGQYLTAEIMRAGVKDVPPSFCAMQKELHRVYCKAMNLGISTAFRPEPVCIWVHGEPGLGKTYNKDSIIRDLLRSAKIPAVGYDMFTVNFSQKHWTGAENKAVIYYDDFGTVDDCVSTPESIAQFMQLISDSRFSPPQAGVEDKGKPVRPRMVYVNANEKAPPFTCIRNEKAFLRRRHICVSVLPSSAFKRSFPGGNLETPGAKDWVAQRATEENPTPHALYQFYNPMDSSYIGAPVVYAEFMKILRSKFTRKANECYANYIRKMELHISKSDITEETPLIAVLEEVKRRAAHVSGDSEVARETFKHLYENALTWTSGCYDMAREWLAGVTGIGAIKTQSAEDPVVCECIGSLEHFLILDENDVLVYNGCELDGMPFVYKCESPDCDYKKTRLLNRFLAAGNIPYCFDALRYRKLYEALTGKSGLWRDVNKPKIPLVEQVKKFVDNAQQTTEPVEWPPQVSLVSKFLGGVAIGLGTYAGMKLLQRLRKDDSPAILQPRDCVVSQLLSSGDNNTTRTQVKRVGIKPRKLAGQSMIGRPTLDVQSHENIINLVDNAIAFLILHGTDRASQQPVVGFPFRVFRLKGRWILMPKHYMSKIERTTNARIDYVSSDQTAASKDVTFERTLKLESSELMLVELSNNVQLARDMTKHIMTERDSVSLTNSGSIFEKILGQPYRIYDTRLNVVQDVHYKDGEAEYVLPCAFEYAWQGPGRCMTPIISTCRTSKIVGFHVAGGDVAVGGSGKPIGCAEPVLRETFDVIPSTLVAQCPLSIEGFSHEAEPAMDLDLNAKYLGTVKPKYAARPSDRTRIVPTEIHNYVPPTTRPAPQKPSDVGGQFSPLKTGVEKHGHPPKRFDPKLLAAAGDALLQQYITACKPVRLEVGVLSVEQAVLGIPGLDGYQAMELSTSEGFPYTASRPPGESNKRYLFDINDERTSVTLDPSVVSIMHTKENMRNKGIVPLTVFTDCLKDARIPREKFYLPGKTRIFSISPVDYTIQFRQYFLDLLAAQKVNRLDLEHAVGINVHSFEWTQLGRRVTSKGRNMLCGDYSNFGPGLSDQVVDVVINVWVKWYEHWETHYGVDPEEVQRRATVRRCLMQELRHSTHLCQNILYQVLCGSPSGAPCTVNLNNDVNKLYIYMAWISLFLELGDPVMATIVAFRQHVSLYVYGDDLLAGVSDKVIHLFNNKYLQDFLAKHDIKYTDETKSGTVSSHVAFEEASFLKGKWLPHPTRQHVFTYAQDKKSTEDVANWCFGGNDTTESTRQAICDSLMLSFGQGPEYFEEHRQRLLRAWAESSCVGPLTLYSYEEMDNIRFGWMDAKDTNKTTEELVAAEQKWRRDRENIVELAKEMQSMILEDE